MAQVSVIETSISVENLAHLEYSGVPVVTTKSLAIIYETNQDRIRDNFRRRRDHFVLGKHYFKVRGEELKGLKESVCLTHALSTRGGELTLWTERGAARHAKMLDTDTAWEVFEKLEDCYFSRTADKPKETERPQLSRRTTAAERNPLAVLVNKYLGKLGPSRSNYTGFWRKTFHPVFGVAAVEELTIDQLPKAIAFMEALLAAPALEEHDAARVDAAIKAHYDSWRSPREKLQNDIWRARGIVMEMSRDIGKISERANDSNIFADSSLAQQAFAMFTAQAEKIKADIEALQPIALVAYSAIANALELRKNRQTLMGIRKVLPQ